VFPNDAAMVTRLTLARLVQTGFFGSGALMLLTVSFGWGGPYGSLLALAATIPFSASVMFGLRCKVCGVSHYFDPNSSSRNLSGVNPSRFGRNAENVEHLGDLRRSAFRPFQTFR
jgi:hypothetical protein